MIQKIAKNIPMPKVDLKAKPYNLSDEDIKWVKDTIAGMTTKRKSASYSSTCSSLVMINSAVMISQTKNFLKSTILAELVTWALIR